MRKLAVLLTGLAVAMVLLLAAAAAALGGASSDGAGLSSTSRVPAELVPIIERAAAADCDLPVPLLAAVLKVESNFNNAAVNPDSGAFTMGQNAATATRPASTSSARLPTTSATCSPRPPPTPPTAPPTSPLAICWPR